MEFEWDLEKAAANLRKHRVSFSEAAGVLADPHDFGSMKGGIRGKCIARLRKGSNKTLQPTRRVARRGRKAPRAGTARG